MATMSVSPGAARKMQIIGAIILPVGAVLLIIGAIKFGQLMSGFMDLDPFNFGAIAAEQMTAFGFIAAGAFTAFVGFIFLIIGSTRKSMSAGLATAVPSTIESPVPTIGNPISTIQAPVEQEMTASSIPQATQASTADIKFCAYCGARNGKEALRCANCTAQL